MVSVTTTQLCSRTKATIENTLTQEYGRVPVKFYLQEQKAGQIQPSSCCLLTPSVEQKVYRNLSGGVPGEKQKKQWPPLQRV